MVLKQQGYLFVLIDPILFPTQYYFSIVARLLLFFSTRGFYRSLPPVPLPVPTIFISRSKSSFLCRGNLEIIVYTNLKVYIYNLGSL